MSKNIFSASFPNSDKLMSYDGKTFVYDDLGKPRTYKDIKAIWEYGRQLMSFDDSTSS